MQAHEHGRSVRSTRKGGFLAGGLAVLVVATGMSPLPSLISGKSARRSEQAPVKRAADFGRLPLHFEPNRGQADPGVGFVARGAGYSLALTPTGAALSLSAKQAKGATAPGTPANVAMRLEGGRADAPSVPVKRLIGVSNYLRGDQPNDWITGVPNYGGVEYRGVYPGIDVLYHGKGRSLEYDFVVAPGADPGTIALSFPGAQSVSRGASGELRLDTPAGVLRHAAPVAYQVVDGQRRSVTSRYVVSGSKAGFRVGAYDRTRPLVIDPVLVWSTHLGGGVGDTGAAIAIDADGNSYVTGATSSDNFPTVAGAHQVTRAGSSDAYVTKIANAGNSILWSTFLGGAASDSGAGIAVDSAGDAYVTGSTNSTNFPTAGPTPTAYGGGTCGTIAFPVACTDAFVARIGSSGTSLVWSRYLGGNVADSGSGIAVSPAGAYVTGSTNSATFPTASAAQAGFGGGTCGTAPNTAPCADAFVTRYDLDGTLGYSTYLGGAAADSGARIAVDSDGAAYVTGATASVAATSPQFPTATPRQPAPGGAGDAFVTKLDPAGTTLTWSTFHGGSGADSGIGIAIDTAKNVYVTGETASTNFPTVTPLQPAVAGGTDAFVSKFAAAGTSLAWSTYLGGGGFDAGAAVAVLDDVPHVVGQTFSDDFPTAAPMQEHGGNVDVFILQLQAGGNALNWSTFLGGTGNDVGRGIAVDSGGRAYVAGSTQTADFPTVAPLRGFSGDQEAIVARIDPIAPLRPLVTGIAPRSGPPTGGTPVVITGNGLAGATAVRFGTVPAASFTESAGRITAVSPAQPKGPVSITVTTPQGSSPGNPVSRFVYAEGLWESTGRTTAPRFTHTLTLAGDGTVLAAAGRRIPGPATLTSSEVFDPRTGTWTANAAPMGTPRASHTATLLSNGKILVAGGFTGASDLNAQPVLDSAELYDPATRTWAPTGAMNVRRALHTATLLPNGKVLVAGGRTCSSPPPATCNFTFVTQTSELYDPATGTWALTGTMTKRRHTTNATLLGNGTVLVPAGFGEDENATAETYNPSTGTWTATGAMNQGRSRQGAMLLQDGRVLVASGFTGGASSEVYDPATRTWAFTAASSVPGRFNFFQQVLPNGKALIAGGGVGGASSDIYDPVTDAWESAGLMQGTHGSTSSLGFTREAVLLSSRPDRFEADPGVCGRNCGKALVAGDSLLAASDLYRPAPSLIAAVHPAGSPTTTVKISGTGFTDASAVLFGGVPASSFTVDSYSLITAVAPPRPGGGAGTVDISVITPAGASPTVSAARYTYVAQDAPVAPDGTGYRTVARDGGIFAFGGARFFGSTGAIRLNQPVVGMATTPSNNGYWLVASDGGIFAFGDARFFGSTGAIRLNQPIVGMASTPSGNGYWLVAADGGIFSFGDARFFGSTGAIRLTQPMVGMASTPTGRGYWMVASDGGIFAFGDARFSGSTGAIRLNQPMVGMTPTTSGNGYWLVASDGGIFAFGDARFLGSTGAIRLNQPVVGISRSPSGNGYRLVASDGGIFSFGDAPFFGSTGAIRLNQPMVGIG